MTRVLDCMMFILLGSYTRRFLLKLSPHETPSTIPSEISVYVTPDFFPVQLSVSMLLLPFSYVYQREMKYPMFSILSLKRLS